MRIAGWVTPEKCQEGPWSEKRLQTAKDFPEFSASESPALPSLNLGAWMVEIKEGIRMTGKLPTLWDRNQDFVSGASFKYYSLMPGLADDDLL